MNQDKNITVMLTTHDIDDIEDLCDRIVVLDEGQKIYDGKLDDLVNRFSSRRLVLETDDVIEPDIEGIKDIQKPNGKVEIVFDREIISVPDLMKEILERYDVSDFHIKEPDIEAVVKKIYNEGLADRSTSNNDAS